MNNGMELTFSALAQNEGLARMVIGAFLVQINPTVSLLSEVRTAVSEAVTNAIVHAYGPEGGRVVLRAWLTEDAQLCIEVEDFGRGMADVAQAMQPFFTTQPDQERTGMGFALMQAFMDDVRVTSAPESGTVVQMRKRLEAP